MRYVFCCASALHLLFICLCLNPQWGAVPDKTSPGTVSAGVEVCVQAEWASVESSLCSLN